MRAVAFVETSPGRVFVGWGPFEAVPCPEAGRPAFYIPDYFLDNPKPWLHPASFEEISREELVAHFEGSDSAHVEVTWETPSKDQYQKIFESAQGAIRDGRFEKIVPVLFEHGALRGEEAAFGAQALRALRVLPAPLTAYGLIEEESCEGFVGATPELLFRIDGHRVETMALAGTRPLDRAHELETDPKEQREHEIVVWDLVSRLRPFGEVQVGRTELARFPRLAHLRTPLRLVTAYKTADLFSALIRALHPTAALGSWPRNAAAWDWLRSQERFEARRQFGAPFGVVTPDGRAAAWVGIRQVSWRGDRVRIGAGSGVLSESSLDGEWDELATKRRQVKTLLLEAR